MPEEPKPKPIEHVVDGDPWSLIFAPHPTVPANQAIWLFNQKDGELWELIANNNFVLRPRSEESAETPKA